MVRVIQWLILALLVVAAGVALPTDGLRAQVSTTEAPVLRPGEFWVWQWEEEFRDKRSGTYRRTVVRKDTFEGQDAYILSRGDGTFSVVTLDLVTIATIDGVGNIRTRFVNKGDNYFPLSVGRVFTREYDTPVGRYRGTYRYTVTAVEELRTRAGAFSAFRVAWEGKGTFYDGRPFTASGVQYYAPAAKIWVKSSFSVDTGYKYADELVSHQVLPD